MIYKFKSRETGDLIMLEPDGRRVLELIGKTPGPQGIIEVDQMPAAIAALNAAIAKAEADFNAAAAAAGGPDNVPVPHDVVSLRQRATPFIAMLKECAQAGHDIVWGV
ncbi:MAG: DUF1840 domain-containing protein [Rhodoferax sp.]